MKKDPVAYEFEASLSVKNPEFLCDTGGARWGCSSGGRMGPEEAIAVSFCSTLEGVLPHVKTSSRLPMVAIACFMIDIADVLKVNVEYDAALRSAVHAWLDKCVPGQDHTAKDKEGAGSQQ